MIQNKTEIFKEIVDIMSNDYSGCEDKRACNHPEKYVITDEMDDEDFIKIVNSYLLEFQDYHVWFRPKSGILSSHGFSIRRYENKLYVTRTTRERALTVGDIIVSIDDTGIDVMAELHRKELFDNVYERQNWDKVLSNAKTFTVQRCGMEFEHTIKQYDVIAEPPVYSFDKLNTETCLLTLHDFADERAINSLLNKNHETIINSNNLIIDVRENGGGFDMAFYRLLSYVFPGKILLSDLFTDDDAILYNCTERNYNLRKDNFTKDFQDVDEQTAKFIKEELLFLKENYGKGFVLRQSEMDFKIDGRPAPASIFILTDWYCRSSGDAFAQIAKKSSKVTVIGRNTRGITDYSNCVYKDYGDCRLFYPTTKVIGNHINGIGVDVDIYIPWTPEHLVKDVDLEKALSMT